MRFEIYKDRAGEWRWRFIASNGRIIAVSSEGYARRRSCWHAIGILSSALRKGPQPRIEQI